jgi:hypothetical protein
MNIYNSLNHINIVKKTIVVQGPVPDYLQPGNISCCWSTRLLISSYTGPILNIRRSSDNVFANVYTNSNQSWITLGANNTGQTYSSWIGANTGYISTWYDQSGKANDLKNTTNNTTQPILTIQNSKYVVNWINGSSTVLNITTPLIVNTIFSHFYNTNSTYGTIISSNGDSEMRFGPGGALNINGDSNSADWYYSSTGTKLSYVNGSSSTTLSGLNTWQILSLSVQTPPFSFYKVGADGFSNSRSINGYMTEMILHNKQMIASSMVTYNTNRFF